eukprot:9358142-Karenia_brevis.AAC.1
MKAGGCEHVQCKTNGNASGQEASGAASGQKAAALGTSVDYTKMLQITSATQIGDMIDNAHARNRT